MRDDLARAFARTASTVTTLAEMPLGPALIARLVEVANQPMTSATAVDVAALWTRVESWVAAKKMISTADALNGMRGMLELDKGEALMLTAQELACATRVSYATSANSVALVERVSDCLPKSWEALDRGDLTLSHLRAVERETRNCPARVAQRVEEQVVALAIERGWTPSETAKAARKLVLAADPDGARDRADAAKAASDVRLYSEPDGVSTIVSTGDALRSRQIMDVLNDEAEAMGRAGDDRPVGQRRFDSLFNAVVGKDKRRAGKPARPSEAILHLDLLTYLGLNDKPGELIGYGPISAEDARRIAADCSLRRLITDPLTGEGIDLGRKSYRPSVALRRYVEAVHPTCTMPGCCRPAYQCEVDHRREFDRTENPGSTNRCNLRPLCKMHHDMKTKKWWKVDQNPDGSETWTSYLGFKYTKKPSYFPLPDPPPIDDEAPIEIADRLPDAFDPDPPRDDEPLPEPPSLTEEQYEAMAESLAILDAMELSFRQWCDKHYDEARLTGLVA